MQIRNYKTTSELRRVVKSLSNNLKLDKLRLAAVRRSINVASLKDAEVTAAPRKTAAKPVKKTTPAKPTRRNVSDEIFQTRGPGAGGRAPTKKPTRKAALNLKNVQKLTDLLGQRQDRLQVAEHIRQLLIHHFDKEDRTVVRLLNAVNTLVKESQSLFNEAESTLNDMSQNEISEDFTLMVEDIADSLKEKFEDRFDAFDIKYSMAVKSDSITKSRGINKTEVDASKVYHIAYLIFDNLQGTSTTQDYVVAITKVSGGRGERYFIRTLMEYRPPNWLVKHSPGIEFDEPTRALRIIYNTMAMEDMLDVAEQTALPVKKAHVKYQNQNVADVDIDEKGGQIKIYLKPGIDDAEARRVLIDLFAETKRIVKAVHPRYKNPVKALSPKKVKRTVKLKNGKTKQVEQWIIVFAFAKMQGEDQPIQMPRDKIKQFMDTFDIDDEETARDFNRLLRNFLGVK